ncbi:RNA polymerase sigma-70 factor, ECF subfamily [Lishizhenia tianjinensis]|uniref:RNA polymerase sigma-70 factor, ECF subfamily n=1 Tax=Lishizhenia tianjinensis TaxID=477690 RepID=A0A1I7AD91_9FLAO|nr:RNA polymerase sigma factor [Lishizhenia tianjinensis]SFT72901.1 RNA polymerase sigma-70 factor, ECF subfamily [Lishizhenia tianjinensis]
MLFKKRNLTHLSDAELVDLYKQKQQKLVIAEVYQRYGHLMMGLCLKYLQQSDLAEDMVMDIFEKLPKLLLKHDITYLKSWLYTTTKNECLMALRKKKHHFKDITNEQVAYENELEDKQFLDLQLEIVEEKMDELKTHHKKALKLFYIEGKSYQEIADLLHIDLKKVKSDVQNAKRNLKIKLQEDVVFKSAQ